ncbi:hypothetical protein WA026_005331 [Henosepilachna vigintioctopunctata]|uniref:Uncharacterized protein n=1 Tax=Henosepilachna vigintioctopunctata TaxID=420089 RepID=A0AAW1UV89_9CUCU
MNPNFLKSYELACEVSLRVGRKVIDTVERNRKTLRGALSQESANRSFISLVDENFTELELSVSSPSVSLSTPEMIPIFKWGIKKCSGEEPLIPFVEVVDSTGTEELNEVTGLFKTIGPVDKIGTTHLYNHIIISQGGPIRQRQYPSYPAMQTILNKEIDRMLELDIIKPVTICSPWLSPLWCRILFMSLHPSVFRLIDHCGLYLTVTASVPTNDLRVYMRAIVILCGGWNPTQDL